MHPVYILNGVVGVKRLGVQDSFATIILRR